MNRVKAEAVTTALIGQGYEASAKQYDIINDLWTVSAKGPAIDVQVVATFATNQGITGTITESIFK